MTASTQVLTTTRSTLLKIRRGVHSTKPRAALSPHTTSCAIGTSRGSPSVSVPSLYLLSRTRVSLPLPDLAVLSSATVPQSCTVPEFTLKSLPFLVSKLLSRVFPQLKFHFQCHHTAAKIRSRIHTLTAAY